MPIQSILFDKDQWTIPQATEWLRKNNYKVIKVHTTDEYHRFRQISPEELENRLARERRQPGYKVRYRTIKLYTNGKKNKYGGITRNKKILLVYGF